MRYRLFYWTLAILITANLDRRLLGEVHEIDLSQPTPAVTEWLKLGGKSPNGTTLGVNDRYFTRNGGPWLPIMGEFHYCRYPSTEWERELRKIRAGGVTVVATYALWVNHENPKGTWSWTGDENLRQFVQECSRQGLYVCLRVGPYCNAESRNGGFPDFVASMTKKRSNDPAYLAEVERWFGQLAEQTKGLFFKDGGPIIAIQLENEFASGDPDHIDTLQAMCKRLGMDAPFYTVTANTRCHWEKGTLIPLQGAYPYRGWGPLGFPTQDYMYRSETWGAMFNEYKDYYDASRFPIGFCEMGAGCWCSYNGRFQIKPEDSEALLQDTLGRGSNLVGYYMFHGGTQRAGMEMNGHPLTYDFQAPLGEFGEVRPSYARLKRLHHFINDYNQDLAITRVVRPVEHPTDPKDNKTLRFVAREADGRGFVFLNNTQAWVTMQDQKDLQIRLKLPGGRQLTFPQKPFTLRAGRYAIFPFQQKLGDIELTYATAQPMARFEKEGTLYCIYFAVDGIDPEYAFASESVGKIQGNAGELRLDSGRTIIAAQAGADHAIHLTSASGQSVVLFTLTSAESLASWRVTVNRQEELLLSSANVLSSPSGLTLYSEKESMPWQLLNSRLPHKAGTLVAQKAKCDSPLNIYSDNSYEWHLDRLPAGVVDVRVDVDYIGSTAEFWVDGIKYTDNRLNGDRWTFSLARFFKPGDGKHKFRVTVQPWDDRVKGIPPASQPRTDEMKKGILGNVHFVPIYEGTIQP